MSSISKSKMPNVIDNQCDRCNYIFSNKKSYNSHKKLNRCKKTDFQCDECHLYLSSYQGLVKHKNNGDCNLANKKFVKKIQTTNNTINIDGDVSTFNNGVINNYYTIIDINTLNNLIKSESKFEEITDDDLNVKNVEDYLNILDHKDYHRTIDVISDILCDKYVKNVKLYNRTILTIDKTKVHFVGDDGWEHDIGNVVIDTKCIKTVINKLHDVIGKKLGIINKVSSNDYDTIINYDSTIKDDVLNNIVQRRREVLLKISKMNQNVYERDNVEMKRRTIFYMNIVKWLKRNIYRDVRKLICNKLNITSKDILNLKNEYDEDYEDYEDDDVVVDEEESDETNNEQVNQENNHDGKQEIVQ